MGPYGHETCGVVAALGRVVVQPFLSVTSCHFMSRTLTCTLVAEPFVRSHFFFTYLASARFYLSSLVAKKWFLFRFVVGSSSSPLVSVSIVLVCLSGRCIVLFLGFVSSHVCTLGVCAPTRRPGRQRGGTPRYRAWLHAVSFFVWPNTLP